ncbi:MAG TPA: DUF3048 domain-containing protein [Erysipelotrichaceae bacterium]|nr:DUF3048 domain-containing protein [Erysipelotrichaceae bacterium]
MAKKIMIIMLVLFTLFGCNAPVEEEPEVIVPEVEVIRNQFDGSPLEDGETQTYKAVAVLVNNSAIARPHYGLSKADVVYEVIKEEYLETRFMAIFEGEFPEKVGPLRSIRVPFVRIFNEWQTALVHYGGAGSVAQDGTKNPDSVNALDLLKKIYVPYRFDAVAGINDSYFFRTTDKPAPHNAYIELKDASKDFPDVWVKDHFAFDEEDFSTSDDLATTIEIDYPTKTENKVTYEFDQTTGHYNRFINDEIHLDALYDVQIAATNIIVQYLEHTEVKGYVLVELKYRGDADYFVNGKHVSGYWVKDFEDDTTHWFTENDEELILLPGTTYIQIVPIDFEINWN